MQPVVITTHTARDRIDIVRHESKRRAGLDALDAARSRRQPGGPALIVQATATGRLRSTCGTRWSRPLVTMWVHESRCAISAPEMVV